MSIKCSHRIGEVGVNSFGTPMEIVEYQSVRKIKVKFLDKKGAIVESSYSQFLSRKIKNPYDPVVAKVGYIGEGRYRSRVDKILQTPYRTWRHMLERCYDPKAITPAYEGIKVCEEWHNYQNFAKWWEENYYEVGDDRMDLDKDILSNNRAREYSPSTCVYVPSRVNFLFIKRPKKDIPTGVSLVKGSGKYWARGGVNNKEIKGGIYETVEEAFEVYKREKERALKEHCLELKKKYGDKIPSKVYEAIMTYEIEDM